MKKGQGAMEYLMTYGWALLVIVIVGAALFALGILNPATYQQKRCNGFQYFTYIDQAATATNYTLHFRNGVNDINLSSMTVGVVTTNIFNGTGESENFTLTVDGNAWDGVTWIGQGKEVTINYGPGLSLVSGAYDDLSITVKYDVKNGIQGNTDTATCIGTVV